jgi:hypothetical protein
METLSVRNRYIIKEKLDVGILKSTLFADGVKSYGQYFRCA